MALGAVHIHAGTNVVLHYLSDLNTFTMRERVADGCGH